MDPISPAGMNMLLGLLAKWTSPGDAASDGGTGIADPAPVADPATPSSGNLAPVGRRDAVAAADGAAANPSVFDAEGLPPATFDDAATRFAPSVPVSQSLMGLRLPRPESASPSMGLTSPDDGDARPVPQLDRPQGAVGGGQDPDLPARRDVTPAGSLPVLSMPGARGAGAPAAMGDDAAASAATERDTALPTSKGASTAAATGSNVGAASSPATVPMGTMTTPAPASPGAATADLGDEAGGPPPAAREPMGADATASPPVAGAAFDVTDRRGDALAREAGGADTAASPPVAGAAFNVTDRRGDTLARAVGGADTAARPPVPGAALDVADQRGDAFTRPPKTEAVLDPAPQDPVPGGKAPTLASAAQSLSVPDTPPDGARPHAEADGETDAAGKGDHLPWSSRQDMIVRHRPASAETDAVGKGDHLPWSSRQDAIVEHRPASADTPVLRRDDVSDVDGWALPMLSLSIPADGQVERAGIIASFILNAAMIPGWPPPRPFDMPEAEFLMDHLANGHGGVPNEEALTALLKERGCEEGLLARMRSRLSKTRRLRLLLAMTALWTTIEALIEAVEHELLRVSGKVDDTDGELEQQDTRRTLTA